MRFYNTSDIQEYIKNPHKFNIKREMDNKYYNLWSADNDKTTASDDIVIKTVYDPSPVGFSLPASNAFTGFTTTGENLGDGSTPLTPEDKAKLNIKGSFDRGWYFYTKLNKTGPTLFFPVSGYRHLVSGALDLVSAVGCWWAAGPSSPSAGWYLGFSSGFVYPLHRNYRSYGFAVRSAEEK